MHAIRRCPTYRFKQHQVTLGSSFGPDDSLLAVRNFAAQELELLPSEGVDGPHMSCLDACGVRQRVVESIESRVYVEE